MKNIAKLSMLFVLVALIASCFSISALAEGSGSGSEGGIVGMIGDVYDWFFERFTPVFAYAYGVLPFLADIESPMIHYAILGAVLLVVAIVLIRILVSLFKGRFFRSLARTVLWSAVIWAVSFSSIIVRALIMVVQDGLPIAFDIICGLFHSAAYYMMPALYNLASKLPVLVSVEYYWLLPALFYGLAILIIVICAIIISSSKKRARRKAARKMADAETISADEVALVTAAPETVAVSEPVAEPAIEPAAEAVVEAAPAPESEPVAEAEVADEAVAETIEVACAEETPVEQTCSLDDYPTLATPVFMPIPSSVFDVVDFTNPKRDGFTGAIGASVADAAYAMSDELAESLTAVIYAGAQGGEIIKIGLDCLSANFKPYSYVNVKILRGLGLVPESASAIAVVDHGTIDKPLMIEAADFSSSAVKMLTLAGGRAIRLA